MDTSHPDFEPLAEIQAAIFAAAEGEDKFVETLPLILRQALDEVIDTARTGRIWVSELEKTEKTYIGTKVEIMVRSYLAFAKGRLDLRIANHDVDVKNTIGRSWMIPSEAVGSTCLLLAENDEKGLCSAGLILTRPEYLTAGKNRDGKRSISARGLRKGVWFFRDSPMVSFWQNIDRTVIAHVMDRGVGGTERLRRLFTNVLEVPVPRRIIEGVARQKDYMKRLRKNGGVRDPLGEEGIVVLNGKYDKEIIQALPLPRCASSEFIAFQPTRKKDLSVLKQFGRL